MKILTLTPDLQNYAIAVLAVYAASGAPLAASLQAHWGRARAAPFLTVYVATMACVALAALLVLDLPSAVSPTWRIVALSLPLGMVCGLAAFRSELVLKRVLLRSRLAKPGAVSRAPGTRSPWLRRGYQSGWSRVRAEQRTAGADVFGLGAGSWDGSRLLGALLVAGALEELLFRGILVDLALDLDSTPWQVACLLATVLAFAISHLRLGLIEVVAKLPLGLILLIAALAAGSVLPAVIAHLLFNLQVWRTVQASPAGGRTQRRLGGEDRAASRGD